MSVTGEFQRYLRALIEQLRDHESAVTERLRARLETARARPHAELAGAAEDALHALQDWCDETKAAGTDGADGAAIRQSCDDLTTVSRIVLGR